MRASKHEGAGNDFLVVLDLGDTIRFSAPQIRLLCDRHRGIGADGLIRVGPGRDGAQLSMELHNADGGEAEMSGNGIRCLAQAAVHGSLVVPPMFEVATVAGVRTVTYMPEHEPSQAHASVDMGPVTLDPEIDPVDGWRARTANVGNPHLVLAGSGVAAVDVAGRGPALEAATPGGINIEWIERAEDDEGEFLELRVFERGAGETLACGTGSVAAAAAAVAWGLVDPTAPLVRVHNPGGMLTVTLGSTPDAPAVLAGPVRKVADVDIDPGMLS